VVEGAVMEAYMYDEKALEDLATDAGMRMIAWLYDEGYVTGPGFDALMDEKPVFLYKKLPWYSRIWKKLWPNGNKDSRYLVIVRLPRFPITDNMKKKAEEEKE
jgi:hypothetical protein